MTTRNYFHLHLVSDSTGETLIAVSRAVTSQYPGISAIEHVHPLVRAQNQMDRIISSLEDSPGIVLYTLVDQNLAKQLEKACREHGCPCLSILDPVLGLFQSYLGASSDHKPGAQHVLNSEYFKRIDALNYTMMHDDGQSVEWIEKAEMRMRNLSRQEIETYLDQEGPAVLKSVGCYHYESHGRSLFEDVKGTLPVIMGMPMQGLQQHLIDKGYLRP